MHKPHPLRIQQHNARLHLDLILRTSGPDPQRYWKQPGAEYQAEDYEEALWAIERIDHEIDEQLRFADKAKRAETEKRRAA